MERVLNSIVVAVCAFAAGLAVAHTLRAGDSKAKNKEKGKVNGMAKNEGKSKETPATATESKQQNTGKSSWLWSSLPLLPELQSELLLWQSPLH